MPRPKHALDVSEIERARIRALYLQGVRVADIVRRTERSESVVYRSVRGLHRRKPSRSRLVKRDAMLVKLHQSGLSFSQLGLEFHITATRAWQIVRRAMGERDKSSIKQIAPPKRRHGWTFTPRLTREQRTRRNATIVRLWREGVRTGKLALRFMIHRETVRWILRQRRRGRV